MKWKQLFVPSLLLGLALVVNPAMGQSSVDANQLAGLTNLSAEGVGTYVSNAPVQVSSGSAKGEPFGVATYVTTWNAALDSATTNGSGGNCIRGSGNVTLTTPNGDTLTLQYGSLECDTGSVIGQFAVQGAYRITSGTGRFTGATGTGNIVWAVYNNIPGSPASLHIDGNIRR
jgi:hypothetical protein